MMHCADCKVDFTGELKACPLCGCPLDGKPSKSPFPRIAIQHTSMMARAVLGIITLVLIATIIALCIWIGTSFWYCALSCVAIALNYIFVRSMVAHSPRPMRNVQRYFLVLVAMSLLWYFATGNTAISTFVVPSICILGSLFDIVILIVFRSQFITGYAKYILFAIVLGAVPLALAAIGSIMWLPIAWISGGCALTLLVAAFTVGRSSMRDEVRKLFHN